MKTKTHINLSEWTNCEVKMPENGQQVLCLYKGVSGPRVATYWFDGANHHFGNTATMESHPATHWHAMPGTCRHPRAYVQKHGMTEMDGTVICPDCGHSRAWDAH